MTFTSVDGQTITETKDLQVIQKGVKSYSSALKPLKIANQG